MSIQHKAIVTLTIMWIGVGLLAWPDSVPGYRLGDKYAYDWVDVVSLAPHIKPERATEGTIYYDSDEDKLMLYTGSGWEIVSSFELDESELVIEADCDDYVTWSLPLSGPGMYIVLAAGEQYTVEIREGVWVDP